MPHRQVTAKISIRTKAVQGLGKLHVQAGLGGDDMPEYRISGVGLARISRSIVPCGVSAFFS